MCVHGKCECVRKCEGEKCGGERGIRITPLCMRYDVLENYEEGTAQVDST